MKTFTHVDPVTGSPAMVDVSAKQVSRRYAHARSKVVLGEEIMKHLRDEEIETKKGPVFQTAVLAGIMAAKKTAELIPLCHPLPLEDCKVKISVNGQQEVEVDCTVSITSKTGVEMEALTGASVAALTIYDMCKAFSHDILIKETRLLEKTGGKSDFRKEPAESPRLNGLVLIGGKSTRMQADKGSLVYHGKSQREHLYELLSTHCEKVFISCNRQQASELKEKFPVIEDRFLGLGPMSGMLSALQSEPDAAWLVVACDLPYLTDRSLEYLIKHRNPSKTATAFMNSANEFPEPLITIWEPRSYQVLLQFLGQGTTCPRKVLINSEVELLQAPDTDELRNINFPEERREAMEKLKA